MAAAEGGDTARRATPSEAAGEAQRLLERLLAAVDPDRSVTICTHDHPDPDAIASAWALQHLLSRRLDIDPFLTYGGTIGRASNRAMVQLLGIPLQPYRSIRPDDLETLCLIDTQPAAGNHSLPPGIEVSIAIDHHPARGKKNEGIAPVTFLDVRTEYGATSTMMFYYLKAAGLSLPTKLATAMLLGIKSDTRELERESSEADLHAYLEIFPRADLTLLTRIEKPRIPRRYFEAFHQALEQGTVYGSAIVSDLGEVENPDLVAELADFFNPLEGIELALAIGRHNARLYLSLRSRGAERDAGALLSTVVGDLGSAGGHGMMAGGQIDLDADADERVREVRRRFLEAIGLEPDAEGEALVRG